MLNPQRVINVTEHIKFHYRIAGVFFPQEKKCCPNFSDTVQFLAGTVKLCSVADLRETDMSSVCLRLHDQS